jgi:hypothetical protein
LIALDDHGHAALALAVAQHLGELFLRLLGVAIIDGEALRRVRLTGVGRVGSAVLAEDDHAALGHVPF